MAKIVYACPRDPRDPGLSDRRLMALARRLTPDKLDFSPPRIIRQHGVVATLIPDSPALTVRGSGVLAGVLSEGQSRWWQPGSSSPDGSFAIFRAHRGMVEILSDVAASRTVWYLLTPRWFLAATSQRALIMLSGMFQADDAPLSWWISGGHLGPGGGWDQRLQRLPEDSVLQLDRSAWRVDLNHRVTLFRPPTRVSRQEHRRRFREALEQTIGAMDFDYRHWQLLLSGGVDSRALLCLLPRSAKLRSLTWGRAEALDETDNDATVAQALALHLGIDHRYLPIDTKAVDFDTLVGRFLAAGEGRADDLAGYADGFALWRELTASGVQGLIRGDQGFGRYAMDSEQGVRWLWGCPLMTELSNLGDPCALGLPSQELPPWFQREDGESLAGYRDRLFFQFRSPVKLAALSDLKLPFVEIVNPLLTSRLRGVVENLPEELRDDRRLFRELVVELGPSLGFARYPAIPRSGTLLRSPGAVAWLRETLSSREALSLFPEDFLRPLAARLKPLEPSPSTLSQNQRFDLRAGARRWLPVAARRLLKRVRRAPRVEDHLLAFRVGLAVGVRRLFAEDARVLETISNDSAGESS